MAREHALKPRSDGTFEVHPSKTQRIAELEEALRPFAEYGRVLRLGDRRGAAMKVVCDLGRVELTMGDFDRARTLLEPTK